MAATELDFDSCYRAVSARDPRFDGRFYTAVTTTRIYCRPICPARTPSARNVRFYRHAATAEAAGFRPCKRCRPELSPGDPGWNHRGDTVGRALRLIDEGVADDHGVAGLAGRLHITERHLHRLFVGELGVGPLAVARTKRMLLAKQLLTETALPIGDVAFASGFGSLRQFNATMKEVYGFPPGELRRAARAADPQARAEGSAVLSVRLHHRTPYEAGALLAFLAARAVPGLERVTETAYSRVIPGGVITLTPQPGFVRLDAALHDAQHLARIVARSRRLLDLDADPQSIAAVLGATAVAPLLEARPGLRVPGAYDTFELAVRGVVGQQISVAGARTMLGRLITHPGLGTRVAGSPDPALTHVFPTPERLAETDLTGLGFTTRRAQTLRVLAEHIATGRIDLDGGQEPAEARARLMEVPGIGPWTAGYIALRAMSDPDAWPDGDLGLRRAMRRLSITDDDIERTRPWRAYAALHLWSSP
ncbi:AraC family transcriptional regulator, regulatory protein of adaptative response / DNA-3-methyladenine glycosylase II [Sinosporangium album]|uniref:DNA-3-methyladenine glycosylase II n=1 Tax=Sinosporangium album TaxID=504805 RepID=A0A1G7W3I2_9ACTN|nr:DNA-3-methyladenine glycosylase 2 family protein [Sinosporangium album]SDG66458.1 AraC family transcriptional regulator, regulatory protein of adaptative response / DNA-3-methyladenine glycosylase II [Sinosporangium album]